MQTKASLFLAVLNVNALFRQSLGAVSCNDTLTCETMLRKGSVCVDGVCSNPFQSGCLRSYLGEKMFPNKRVCNSDDSPDAAKTGLCNISPFDYDEIRILNMDWSAPMMSSWIMQIILSEVLQVPTTIETSSPDKHFNFHDSEMPHDFAHMTYDFQAIRTATEVGDCRKLNSKESKAEVPYRSCAHIMPMVSEAGQRDKIQELRDDAIINLPQDNTFDAYRWFVPHFLAEKDPSILSHYGIKGESNRKKLAKTFKRPTTWDEYCRVVSPNNCTTEDDIASRMPEGDNETGRYFVSGLYKGHFRATGKNDCDANPKTCTGHITNVPCLWATYVISQAHHLNIAVESDGPLQNGGYDSSSVLEIWDAANATESNVLIYWYEPHPLIQSYRGSRAEFVPVILTPPTKECFDNRVNSKERCSANKTEQIGSSIGSCDHGINTYQMLTSVALNVCDEIEEASCSPAYDAIRSFEISALDLEEIFGYWYQRNIDRWNYDGREAVCRWVAENLDTINQSMIPKKHPRQRRDAIFYQPMLYVTMGIGVLAVICVILCLILSLTYRKTKVMRYAQVDLLYMVLSGIFLLSVAAVLYSRPPNTKFICVAREWLVLIGYSLELIPMVVKVAVINKIFQASEKLNVVKIERSSLYKLVGGCVLLACTYLTIWTLIDPSIPQSKMVLLKKQPEDDIYIVEVSQHCESTQSSWWHISVSIYLLTLLITTSAIAAQNFNIRQDFNESKYLALMIYSHLLFGSLRTVVFFSQDTLVSYNISAGIMSLLLSLDSLATIGIYFVPKLVTAKKSNSDAHATEQSGGTESKKTSK